MNYISIHQRKITFDEKESLGLPQKQARSPRRVKWERAMSTWN